MPSGNATRNPSRSARAVKRVSRSVPGPVPPPPWKTRTSGAGARPRAGGTCRVIAAGDPLHLEGVGREGPLRRPPGGGPHERDQEEGERLPPPPPAAAGPPPPRGTI